MLGTAALIAGTVALGAYALDLHSHTCEACGHHWRHLGAFNLGDLAAHTCRRCGTVQWWKEGWQHADGHDGALQMRTRVETTPSARATAIAAMQELREGPRTALPSGWPR
jgi:hypothetical protein